MQASVLSKLNYGHRKVTAMAFSLSIVMQSSKNHKINTMPHNFTEMNFAINIVLKSRPESHGIPPTADSNPPHREIVDLKRFRRERSRNLEKLLAGLRIPPFAAVEEADRRHVCCGSRPEVERPRSLSDSLFLFFSSLLLSSAYRSRC